MEMSVKKRIVKIINELRITKEGENTFSKYEYFLPDDIMRKLNPLLEKYELITVFNLTNKDEKYYNAVLSIEDCNSPDKIEYTFDIAKATVKGANEAQNSGATMTYAKRYLLMNAFNIADNDIDYDSDKMTAKNNKQINQINQNKANATITINTVNTNDNLISDKQRKYLFAKAKEKEYTNEQIKSLLSEYGIESTSEITKENFNEILKRIEAS